MISFEEKLKRSSDKPPTKPATPVSRRSDKMHVTKPVRERGTEAERVPDQPEADPVTEQPEAQPIPEAPEMDIEKRVGLIPEGRAHGAFDDRN